MMRSLTTLVCLYILLHHPPTARAECITDDDCRAHSVCIDNLCISTEILPQRPTKPQFYNAAMKNAGIAMLAAGLPISIAGGLCAFIFGFLDVVSANDPKLHRAFNISGGISAVGTAAWIAGIPLWAVGGHKVTVQEAPPTEMSSHAKGAVLQLSASF